MSCNQKLDLVTTVRNKIIIRKTIKIYCEFLISTSIFTFKNPGKCMNYV